MYVLCVARSVRASHILIGGSGDTYLAGLRSSYCAYRHGRRLMRVHQFPELASDGLNWLSPEILAQVRGAEHRQFPAGPLRRPGDSHTEQDRTNHINGAAHNE